MPFSGRVQWAAGLLKTGQTTQYSSELDDGFYEKGIAKSYTVLSTGAYSGTVNIDLSHYSGVDIAFVNGTPDTITSTVLDFTTLFVAADVIVISGAANPANNGAHTIAGGGVAANVLTLTSNTTLVNEAAGPTIVIAKREAKSNNCVQDNNTGLMWSRYVSGADMGPASDGKMPWTGQLYDIFQYCAACNAASLGGYTDWRVPNDFETVSILIINNVDGTAFPGWPTSIVTSCSNGAYASLTEYNLPRVFWKQSLYATAQYTALVRGGI